MSTTTTKPTGSGFGVFVKGGRITSVSDVKVGDLLLTHSRQFNADNVMRVLSVESDKFYGSFVSPKSPLLPRLHDDGPICIWDWTIAQSDIEVANQFVEDFFRAKGPEFDSLASAGRFIDQHGTLLKLRSGNWKASVTFYGETFAARGTTRPLAHMALCKLLREKYPMDYNKA